MHQIIGVTESQPKFRLFFDEVVCNLPSVMLTHGSRPEEGLIANIWMTCASSKCGKVKRWSGLKRFGGAWQNWSMSLTAKRKLLSTFNPCRSG